MLSLFFYIHEIWTQIVQLLHCVTVCVCVCVCSPHLLLSFGRRVYAHKTQPPTDWIGTALAGRRYSVAWFRFLLIFFLRLIRRRIGRSQMVEKGKNKKWLDLFATALHFKWRKKWRCVWRPNWSAETKNARVWNGDCRFMCQKLNFNNETFPLVAHLNIIIMCARNFPSEASMTV